MLQHDNTMAKTTLEGTLEVMTIQNPIERRQHLSLSPLSLPTIRHQAIKSECFPA